MLTTCTTRGTCGLCAVKGDRAATLLAAITIRNTPLTLHPASALLSPHLLASTTLLFYRLSLHSPTLFQSARSQGRPSSTPRGSSVRSLLLVSVDALVLRSQEDAWLTAKGKDGEKRMLIFFFGRRRLFPSLKYHRHAAPVQHIRRVSQSRRVGP